MKFQHTKIIQAAGLLAVTPAAWAHPALFEGNLLANLTHQLTQPDHLLILAGVGLVAGIVWLWKAKA